MSIQIGVKYPWKSGEEDGNIVKNSHTHHHIHKVYCAYKLLLNPIVQCTISSYVFVWKIVGKSVEV